MALKQDKLLMQLDQLREQIKSDEKLHTGRVPFVCSDDVLREIAKKKPLKTSDFLAISGLGKKFSDSYASLFLQVIKQYQNNSIKEVKVSKKAFQVLDHYKDRLTNISRRNPNLYMGKISKKTSFDLSILNSDDNIISFLTDKKVSKLDLPINDASIEQHLTSLYREVNKDDKETGSYDLFIAYPYVEGIFKKDSFAIRAPLLYFPVTLERKKRNYILVKNKEKDIIYNRDLLLAASKMEQSEIDANTPYINSFSKKILNDLVLPFYKNNGVPLSSFTSRFQFETFENILKDIFVKRKKGIFQIKEYITLGRYKLYSSMIQKDMSKILDSSKYNDLLEGLIEEQHLFDDEKAVVYSSDDTIMNEHKLSYINDINYSQEKVIDLLNKERKLVIWGPPGTGKSQTITNLIAASILKGENVLVISEKKVALDVIYSRLKDASKYTMFIDDAMNKQSFYHKLKSFINPIPPMRTLNNDAYTIEEEIEEILSRMNQGIDLLYDTTIQGIPINELYARYVQDKDVILELTPKKVHKMFLESFRTIDVSILQEIENKFSKKKELIEYMEYYKILKYYPILHQLETKISRSNRLEFTQISELISREKQAIHKSWFFKKGRLKRAFLNQYSNRILFLTKKKRMSKKYLELFLQDDTLHTYVALIMTKLNKLKEKYSKLTKYDLRYLNMLLHHPLLRTIDDVAKYHSYLFDSFYTGYVEEYYAKHQKQLSIFKSYHKYIQQLDTYIHDKTTISFESLEMELYKHALQFSNTKRIIDIKRLLDSGRKPSIKAFIDIFQMELMNHIRIWMMTPEVVSAIVPLEYGMFDLVIFDEASQMFVEKGIPAIYRAKKVVIAGDTKQLRPSSLGMGRLEDDDDFYEEDIIKDASYDAKSLLDLARYKYKESILNYHYRSIYEELIAFSNYAFYDANLIVSPNQKESQSPPIEYIYVPTGVFDQRRNLEEAKKVISLIKKIFRTREHNETIGIITFNSPQRDLIENLIDEELFKRGKYQKALEQELFRVDENEDQSLFVKNIENVQGDERDIIIFSMGYGRNPDGFIRRQFGWLNNDGGQNRLNVAISRAKQKIYFVSSLLPEELKVSDLKSRGPKLLKDYMRYCYYVSNNNKDMAQEILHHLYDSEDTTKKVIKHNLIQDVSKRLLRYPYEIHTNIGIGSYTIDIGIYDPATKTYKLGILCDISKIDYRNARKELYHYEKYLSARHWNIYRVFASNWYTNPNLEIKHIKEYL